MAFLRPKQVREDATFDLTAMIDVVLLLIIFFMLTSQFAATDRAAVELPAQKGLEAAAATKGTGA
jgi:biopolymer transport protein ExbD